MGFGPEGGGSKEANVVAGLGKGHPDAGGDVVGARFGQEGPQGFEEGFAGGGHSAANDDQFRGEAEHQVADANGKVLADLIEDFGGFGVAMGGAFGHLGDVEAQGFLKGNAGGELLDGFAGVSCR